MSTDVRLADLLDRVRALLIRYVLLPGDEYADTIALWVVHAHTVMAATTSPRLVFKSPEKASGKTRALEVLDTLVPAAVNTINASVAYIFRKLKETQVTLLFDEVDSIFDVKAGNLHNDLRGLLNAGWQKGKMVGRVVGEGKKMRTEEFPVYAAVALAAIGNLPETIESRAIIVPMRRRAPDEPLEPFRLRKVITTATELRNSLASWAARHGAELTESEPLMPEGLSDRMADAWETLVAIGDLANEAWGARARAAAQRIAGGHVLDERSRGIELLSDIRTCFASDDRMPTVMLLDALNGLEEADWGGWNNGKGINARDLARRLKPFGVASRNLKLPDGRVPKGYLWEDFRDAWKRYCPPAAASPSSGALRALSALPDRISVAPVAPIAPPRRARGDQPNELLDGPDADSLAALLADPPDADDGLYADPDDWRYTDPVPVPTEGNRVPTKPGWPRHPAAPAQDEPSAAYGPRWRPAHEEA